MFWNNFEDVEKEYEFILNTPAGENGFTNSGFRCSFDEFINTILPVYISCSKGEKLHYFNDYLREGAGHIGYGIKKE